jgi:SNF2 family DNA or RNA helicase
VEGKNEIKSLCLCAMSNMYRDIGLSKLNKFQKSVLDECLIKGSGGLSLPMGSGKTIIGIVLALSTNDGNGRSLVVVNKSLVESWTFEIKKFFGETLPFVVFHGDKITDMKNFALNKTDKLVITTPETLSKFYTENNIDNTFVHKVTVNLGRFNQHVINSYPKVKSPFLVNNGSSLATTLYSQEWNCVIIDEAHNHTNLQTVKCKAISALYSKHKWAMSGTLFNEPKVERILGYHLLINDANFPRTLPDAQMHVRSQKFKGIISTIVQRTPLNIYSEGNEGTLVHVNKQIISTPLCKEEEIIYTSMKTILKTVQQKFKEYKIQGDIENTRKFSVYLLAMLTYLRQSIVCPLLVYANCALDIADFQNRSDLSKIITREFGKLGINDYLNNVDSVVSSRMKAALNTISNHPNEDIVIFSCFRTSLDVLKEYLPKDRCVYSLESSMSIQKRASVVENFKTKKSKGNIMLLTYDIGCEGLNLQTANTVLLLDMFWNDGKSQQAIARVLRKGQTSKQVNVYIFTSNTGVERVIYNKQDEKLTMLEEMKRGPITSKITAVKVNKLIELIDIEDCVKALRKIHK